MTRAVIERERERANLNLGTTPHEIFLQLTDLKELSRLTDRGFVTDELLIPAAERLRSAGSLTSGEAAALGIVAKKTIVKAGDFEQALPGSPSTRSQATRRLTNRNLLRAVAPGAPSSQLTFAPNELTVHLVSRLNASGLLPASLAEDPI